METTPEEERPPVRGPSDDYCWVCGLVLTTPVEKRIGVHIRCVHNENKRAANAIKLKVPSYGGRTGGSHGSRR